MLVMRKSVLSGKVRTLDIPITQKQMDLWTNKVALIQEIMPDLTPSQREFILSGTVDEEWNTLFEEELKEGN